MLKVLRVVVWSLYTLVGLVAVVVLPPRTTLPQWVVVPVSGQARPHSATVPMVVATVAAARCADVPEPGPFVPGPARMREDGQLVITGMSHDSLKVCYFHESGHTVSSGKPADGSARDYPFGMVAVGGYLARPGGTVVGYAGTDVAALTFRTPDGLVIAAEVREGVFVFELPSMTEYEYRDLTHEAFDANGTVIPGR
jgi:hypothetical protein